MSFGAQERERRRRRQLYGRLFRIGLFLAMPVAAFLLGYALGRDIQEGMIDMLNARNDALDQALNRSERDRAALTAGISEAQRRELEWSARYEAEVPTGERMALMRIIDAQLNQGVEPARLERFIAAAGAQRECDQPVTRRFLLDTPVSPGEVMSVSFADGAVTVTGEGVSARDSSGNPEAWFDRDQPVTITFTMLGGEVLETSGMLPLHNSVLLGVDEARFSIAAADRRGFVEITGSLCR